MQQEKEADLEVDQEVGLELVVEVVRVKKENRIIEE
jgi:hypothetical protein